MPTIPTAAAAAAAKQIPHRIPGDWLFVRPPPAGAVAPSTFAFFPILLLRTTLRCRRYYNVRYYSGYGRRSPIVIAIVIYYIIVIDIERRHRFCCWHIILRHYIILLLLLQCTINCHTVYTHSINLRWLIWGHQSPPHK